MAGNDPQQILSQVYEALRTVEDPELKRDVVSLGFVQNLKIEDGNVSFDIERNRASN